MRCPGEIHDHLKIANRSFHGPQQAFSWCFKLLKNISLRTLVTSNTLGRYRTVQILYMPTYPRVLQHIASETLPSSPV